MHYINIFTEVLTSKRGKMDKMDFFPMKGKNVLVVINAIDSGGREISFAEIVQFPDRSISSSYIKETVVQELAIAQVNKRMPFLKEIHSSNYVLISTDCFNCEWESKKYKMGKPT